MKKNYVFWRKPDGTPHRKTDGEFAPTALLAQIGTSAKVVNDTITWNADSLWDSDFIVRSALVVMDSKEREINEHDAGILVDQAMRSMIKKMGGGQPINPEMLRQAVNKLAADFLRRSTDNYIVRTSISLNDLPAKSICIGGCTITGLKSVRNFREPEALSRSKLDAIFLEHRNSSKYAKIAVHTSGRSSFEAVDIALNAVNLLRGLWTLFSTYGQRTLHFNYSRPQPLGVIHLGPIHTLHQPDGSPAADLYWFEPGYLGDKRIFRPNRNWDAVERWRKHSLRKIVRSPYRFELESLIMRYAEALDQSNLDLAFLQLWSILEKVTDTIGLRYDETIERAIWGLKDVIVARETLSCLRTRRNQYVHTARSSTDQDQFAAEMKSFVEPHLFNLISNPFAAKSISEYGKCLGLPRDLGTLKSRQDQLRRAQKLLFGRKPKGA